MTVRPAARRRAHLRRTPARFWVTLIVLGILVAPRLIQNRGRSVEVPAERATAYVQRAVDGDTLLLGTGERVRLLGVDTPETKHPDKPPEPFGKEAANFTSHLLDGKTVRLEFDMERYDKYQRTLAYVYLDDLLVNEELIRQGFSRVQLQYPYRSDMKRRFLNAEQEARAQRAGIWSLPEIVTR